MADKMAKKKTFNPPIKSKNKPELPRKPSVSLTEEQYNEIFDAVLHSSQKEVQVKSPTMGAFAINQAESPKESASVENSQHTQNSQPEKPAQLKIDSKPVINSESTLSTLNSEEITKNATFSTPKKAQKPQRSFREALKNLKKRMNESLSEAESMSETFSVTMMDFIQNEPLSQPTKSMTKRERLLWLQERRGTGLYVKCDEPKCAKWRWLENPDPVDLPQKWYCHMNPNKEFSTCAVAQQHISVYVERDLIQNLYTAGSIVWAKVTGFPWWPGMVCDCPETEQYYWMDNELDDEPDWYHVVFFDTDNQVTRKWLRLNDLRSFKHCPNLDKKFSSQGFKKRMEISKKKANEALNLHIKDRLKRFSFIALWDKEIPEDSDTDSDESDTDLPSSQFDRYVKKQIFLRRKAMASKNKPCLSLNSSLETIGSSIMNSPFNTPKNNKKSSPKPLKEIGKNLDKKKIEKQKKAEKEKAKKEMAEKEKAKKEMAEKEKAKKEMAEKEKAKIEKANVTKSTTKISNNRRISKDNKVVSSKIHKNIENSYSNFENRVVTRRKSTGEIKETSPQNSKSFQSAKNSQNYDDEEMQKAIEIYNDCVKHIKDERNNSEEILETCTEIIEESYFSSPSPKKKQLRKSSPFTVVTDKIVSKEFEAKRRKTDEKIEPSKMEKIITKAKKSFVPPVKRNENSSTDETMSLDL